MNIHLPDPANMAFALIIFSAAIHAVYNAMIKAARDILIARMLMALASSIYMLPFTFLVPLPSAKLFGLLCLTALVHFIYQMFQVGALKMADYSLAYPVSRGTAPLVAASFIPVVLGDQISIAQFAGIAIISLSILAMGIMAPKGNLLGLLLSVCTGIAIAAYTIIDTKGMRMPDNPLTFLVWFFIFDSITISSWTFFKHRERLKSAIWYELPRGALNGLLGIVTFGSALLAFRYGNAAVMAALRETSVLFALPIGYFFLGDKPGKLRIISVLCLIAGVIMIKTSTIG